MYLSVAELPELKHLEAESDRLLTASQQQVIDSDQLDTNSEYQREAEERPKKKRLTSKNENIFYVLHLHEPSQITNTCKLQVERDAPIALANKTNDDESVLHYGTTSRNSIDGEWPSIILSFSDGRDFELRTIFCV